MDKKEMDIKQLEPESIESVSGGEKITYEEAWKSLPHSTLTECPHCTCRTFVFMGAGEFGGNRFDLLRCRGCSQRYVYER